MTDRDDSENILERLTSPAAKLYEYRLDEGAFLREAADEIARLTDALADRDRRLAEAREVVKFIIELGDQNPNAGGQELWEMWETDGFGLTRARAFIDGETGDG